MQFPMSNALSFTGWPPAWPSRGRCPPQPHGCCRAGGGRWAPGCRRCRRGFLSGGHAAANGSGSHLISGHGLTAHFDPFLQDAEELETIKHFKRRSRVLYLLNFGRNYSKLRNSAATGGVTPSTLEEQPDKEPINPTNPKDLFLLVFVKQCDQTSPIFLFHLLFPPPLWHKPTHFFWSLLPRL